MHYYKARIYSPTLGRFMQTDPIGYEDQVNLYAYVANDPLNLRDPTGTQSDMHVDMWTEDMRAQGMSEREIRQRLTRQGEIGLTGLGLVLPAEMLLVKGVAWGARALGLDKAIKGTVAVIGRFPAYLDLGKAIGAKVFDVPYEIWTKWTPAQQWAANVKFLDRQIARRVTFRLASPVREAVEGTYFARELEYLISRGYKLSKDGSKLTPPGIVICTGTRLC